MCRARRSLSGEERAERTEVAIVLMGTAGQLAGTVAWTRSAPQQELEGRACLCRGAHFGERHVRGSGFGPPTPDRLAGEDGHDSERRESMPGTE